MKLNNVRFLVSGFDASFLFYRDVLNFKVTWGNLGENYAQFQPNDSTAIAIFSRVAHVRDPEGNLLELASDLPKKKYSESLKSDFQNHGQG